MTAAGVYGVITAHALGFIIGGQGRKCDDIIQSVAPNINMAVTFNPDIFDIGLVCRAVDSWRW